MSFGQRDNGELVAFIVCAVFGAIILIAMIASRIQDEERCEAKGGTYYCGYKSSCLCLAPGTVIP